MSEPIELAFSDVEVLDRNGRDHARGEVYHPNGTSTLGVRVDLPTDQVYTAIWTAKWVSDGHVTHGGVAFVLGNATFANATIPASAPAPPPPAESALRALSFAGFAAAAGALVFLLAQGERLPPGAARRRVLVLAVWGATIATVASLALLFREAFTLAIPVDDLVEKSRSARIFAGRALLFAAAQAALLLALAGARRRATTGAAGALLAGAAATFPLLGHAQGAAWWAVPADLVHLLAASAWVGGLACLLLVLPLDFDHRPLALRFSATALGAVAVVVGTGVAAGLLHLGDVARLLTSPYGRILLLKTVLVAAMLALGAANRFLVLPGLDRSRAATFRRVVAVETALGLVVLAVAGVLAGTSPQPPPEPAPGAFDATRASGLAEQGDAAGLRVRLQVAPATVGLNAIDVTLANASGGDVGFVRNVTLYLDHADVNPGARGPDFTVSLDVPTAGAAVRDTGTFKGNATFGRVGAWSVTVAVQRANVYDDAATFEVEVR